jgi:hypothetical protein
VNRRIRRARNPYRRAWLRADSARRNAEWTRPYREWVAYAKAEAARKEAVCPSP